MFIAVHLLVSAAIAAAFAWQFGHSARTVAAHVLLAATCTLQIYLYALNAISNVSWGRNITGHIVIAFFPTVWSGKEPFPVGAIGISAFVCGPLALMTAVCAWW